MRISDWSSDVCSSDLYSIRLSYRRPAGYCPQSRPAARVAYALPMSYERFHPASVPPWRERLGLSWKLTRGVRPNRDRKWVREGRSVSVRVDTACCCLIKQQRGLSYIGIK